MCIDYTNRNDKEVIMKEINRGSRLSSPGGAHRMPPRDLRMARLLEDCYHAELCAVATYTYRSLMCETVSQELSDILDRIAIDETEHFLLLGRLIRSLGGNPTVRTRVQTAPLSFENADCRATCRTVENMLATAMREEREEIDCYQTLMGRCEDRIVRSFLSQIIADEERHVRYLEKML